MAKTKLGDAVIEDYRPDTDTIKVTVDKTVVVVYILDGQTVVEVHDDHGMLSKTLG